MTHVDPTHDDPVVAGMSGAVGGPLGERAARGGAFSVLGVLLAITALTFALGLLTKTTCANDDWSPQQADRFTHACSSEVADEYTGTGLVELAWPWSGDEATRERYPVTDEPALVGLWTYATARVTHLLSGSPDISERYRQPATTVAQSDDAAAERSLFMAVNAVLLAGVAMLATAALAAVHRRRPWDAAGFAAAPVLAVAGAISFDLLAVAAVAGALWAWSRGRGVLAGALLGVGAAAGVWPVLVLAAFLLVAVTERRATWVLPTVVTAVGTWAVLNAPAFLTGRTQWERAWSATFERSADRGSLWRIVADTAGLATDVGLVVSWLLVALWTGLVVALVLLAPARPRVSQVALLLVAGYALLGIVYEPQQALWLLPLAALARPRWRDLLVWQAGEVFFLAATSWWEGGLLSPGDGEQSGFYWVAIVIRLVCTGWLVAVVVRDLWWPEADPVEDPETPPAGRSGDEAQDSTMRSNVVAV
ncbi:hypothetical protein [Nocardioides sp. 1609]|uniref:hypothetical protein n=1 Tax=Nocardioides sp. 1609 TaxID=2508327 RepID=UPI00106FE5F4|nr:hypothetical protein [Nocardioides sp. 1609]